MNDDLSQMCKMFEEAEDVTREAREKSERDRDYTDLKQWTSEEAAVLTGRNQPVVVFDRTKRKVNSLLGLEKQTRKDPKAFPRNPQDEGAAHAATDAIRYVCDDCNWDDRRSSATENLIIEGTGIIKVGVRQTRQGIDPDIKRVAWDRFFHDPHSSEFDFSDAAYMGEVIWKDAEEAKLDFPGKDEELDATLTSARVSDTYDDKPKHNLWADAKRKRVRIVEMYYLKKGEWHFCIFTKGGFLVEPQKSAYLDEEGKPENPYKAVSLYVDRDNNRYGEVRAMIGPQDEINKRRSKALHLITERQVRVSPAVSTDARAVQKILSDPRGVFIGEQGEVEILPHTMETAMANLQMLQEAKTEIDLLGPNDTLQGKNRQDMSGKAILAMQQAGMVETATMLDRVRCLSIAVYRAVWCRIRQYWNEERWIRVTDNERNIRFVGLNKPVTALEAQAKQFGVTRDNFQEFAQQAPEQAQQLAMFAQSPMASQVVDMENNVAELDVDITIDEGVDTPTIAAEQFEQLVQMAGSGIQIPPDVLIEASALRNKDQLMNRMLQGPSPEQQAAQQIQLAAGQAEVEETQSKTMLNVAKAQNEEIKPMIEGLKAGQQDRPGVEL